MELKKHYTDLKSALGKANYVNGIRNISRQNNILKLGVVAAVIVILALIYGIVTVSHNQKVVIIPAVTHKYVLSNNTASPHYLDMMGRYLSGLVLNFTPLTIKKNYNKFLDYVAPESFSGIQSGLYNNMNDYIQSDSSGWFVVSSVANTANEIILRGRERILMSNKVVLDKKVKITINFGITDGEFEVTGYSQSESKQL